MAAMGAMMARLLANRGAAQSQLQAMNSRLAAISATAASESDLVRVTASGDMKITHIDITEGLGFQSREVQANLIKDAANEALQMARVQADEVAAQEMQKMAQEMMGGLGDMFGGKGPGTRPAGGSPAGPAGMLGSFSGLFGGRKP